MKAAYSAAGPSAMLDSTEPLTWGLLCKYARELRSKESYIRPFHWPRQAIDWEKMHQFRIGFFADSPDLFLTSPSEYKRAEEVGAIWYQNEDGSRALKP
jgi:hypothetical protein